MPTYYRLKENIVLRGWDKLPFAVVHSRTKQVRFVSKSQMRTLEMCDGGWDFDSVFCSGEHAENAAELLEKGVVEACGPGRGISPEQAYRLFPNRFVQTVHWSITGRCNFRCRHCFMSAPEARYGELSHGAVMDIARQIGECGIPRVSLTGGEPLLRPDFLDIAAELTRRDVAITQLYTNGSLLAPKVLDGLRELGQHPTVIMSFDGVGCHDWLRGVPGAEAAADAAFALCAERGFRSHAQMVLHKGNVASLPQTVRHLAGVGCASMRVSPVNDVGDWVRNGQGRTLAADEYRAAALDYLPRYYEDGMPMGIVFSGMFSAEPGRPDRYGLPPCCGNGDDAGRPLFACTRLTMQLYADGRPAVCDDLGPDFVGAPPVASDDPACRTAPLREQLSTGSPYMELMDRRCGELHQSNSECASCPYLRHCGGGCRAMARKARGSLLAKDPLTCGFFRDGWAKRVVQTMRQIRPEATSPVSDDPLFS